MPRRRIRLTARAIILLVVGAAATAAAYLLPSPPLLLLGIAALALPPVALLLAVPQLPRFQVRRSVGEGGGAVAAVADGMVAVGDVVEVMLELRGSARRSPPCRIADEVGPLAPEWIGVADAAGRVNGRVNGPVDGHDEGVIELPALDRGAELRRGYALVPGRRGAHRIGPLFAEALDPLGLVRSISPIGGTTSVVVAPRVEAVLPRSPGGEGELGEQRMRQHLLLSGAEDLSTREYRSGDPLRRVHWRQSARLGELMVRQEEPGTQPMLRLVVDNRADGGADAAQFERMLEIAASLAVSALGSALAVELGFTGGGAVPVTASAGGESAAELLGLLATIELGADELGVAPRSSGLRPALAALSATDAPTILVAAEPGAGLLGALSAGARRALAVLVEPAPPLPGVSAPLVSQLDAEGWTIVRLSHDAPLAPALATVWGGEL